MSRQYFDEVSSGERFRFGENWALFLEDFDECRLKDAETSLLTMLGLETLDGMRFLDIGSGSGLFSLAAWRLGATVVSFDFDPICVKCTCSLRDKFQASEARWQIEEGSVLDTNYMRSLGVFDIVYSWGVLHHTGNLELALTNSEQAVGLDGLLFIALYNDQGLASSYWKMVKILYNSNRFNRVLMVTLNAPYLFLLRLIVRKIKGKKSLERGMTLWRDMIDWLGGWPFEVCLPDQVFRRFRDQGFVLQELVTCGGRMGCNEFVFRRSASLMNKSRAADMEN